jgi:hypothetical protein
VLCKELWCGSLALQLLGGVDFVCSYVVFVFLVYRTCKTSCYRVQAIQVVGARIVVEIEVQAGVQFLKT